MLVQLSTELPVSAATAFAQVQRPALLHYVAAPLLAFRPRTPFPERWAPGTYETDMYLLGWVPLGRQRLGIEYTAEEGRYALRDNGGGQLVQGWDHRISIEPLGPAACRYTDQVTIRAGWLTFLVSLFAYAFYAWRQRRWRQLARQHFRAL